MKMNKEQQGLVYEVYGRYWNSIETSEYDGFGPTSIKFPTLMKEEFINKCKTDPKFSEKWGLTIKELELSWEERRDLLTPEQYDGTILENGQRTGFGYISPFTDKVIHYWMNLHNIPTKLITITYNDKTIESYE